ncbi:hypothetical protein KR032_006068 [Drosophila birchii]|nr:hypothetical protein KR032_006068 [Drosophila birchii]
MFLRILQQLSLIFLLAWSSVFLVQANTVTTPTTEMASASLGELALIRKTLARQAQRLRGLEINLHHVLSKVVFLADTDIHAPRRFSTKADPLLELSERLNQLMERLEQETGTKEVLQRIETQMSRHNECLPEGSPNDTFIPMNVPPVKESPKVVFDQPEKSDCFELDERVDGVYKFLVPERNELQRDFYERYCAFATDGPAWTVIQNRGIFDPAENFNRSWDEYRAGFGNLSRDFWFGNEFTHKILYRDDHELRVELGYNQGEEFPDWAEYSLFRLDSEGYGYQLSVDGVFRGSLPDALEPHIHLDFSTYDRRSDGQSVGNSSCAEHYGGGWWLDRCTRSNLNGEHGNQRAGPAILWSYWGIGADIPKTSRMMIRPVNVDSGGDPANSYEN